MHSHRSRIAGKLLIHRHGGNHEPIERCVLTTSDNEHCSIVTPHREGPPGIARGTAASFEPYDLSESVALRFVALDPPVSRWRRE